MENKIPNSDIIGYEGPVGQEKAIHKWKFQSLGVPWKPKKLQDDPNWVQVGVGKWKYIPNRNA